MSGMGLPEILAELEDARDTDGVDGMARFGIAVSRQAFGVRMPGLRSLGKRVGTNHELALALWEHGARETRILATLVDDPAAVTVGQMDGWAGDFDDWEICDQTCMNLFWRTEHAVRAAEAWAEREEEYVKRAAFALVAVVAWKDRKISDERLLGMLDLVVRGASDPRPVVRKSVDWALRQVGKRSPDTHSRALDVAQDLSRASDRNVAWVGRTAARELDSASVRARLGIELDRRED